MANADYAEIGERTIPFLQEITGAIHLMIRSLSQIQSIFSVSGIFNRLSIHIRIQKRLINFKTNFNAMSFEARRIFLYPFIACKFLIVINYTTPLYYFDRYQGAST